MHAASLPAVALPPDLPGRLSALLLALAGLIARRLLRDPFRAAFILPLWTRLNRAAHRVQYRLARLAAGLPCPAPRARPATPAPRRPRTPSVLPRRRTWLVQALGHEAAGYASQLQALLAEPASEKLFATDPVLVRTLRPIRHMLGLTAPRKPRPPAPRRKWVDPLYPPGTPRPWWVPPRRLRTG
jgi:hypothetical protein